MVLCHRMGSWGGLIELPAVSFLHLSFLHLSKAGFGLRRLDGSACSVAWFVVVMDWIALFGLGCYAISVDRMGCAGYADALLSCLFLCWWLGFMA